MVAGNPAVALEVLGPFDPEASEIRSSEVTFGRFTSVTCLEKTVPESTEHDMPA